MRYAENAEARDQYCDLEKIISILEENSTDNKKIYRGENQHYASISSTLYRTCKQIAHIGMDNIERQMLIVAEWYDVNRLGLSYSQNFHTVWSGRYNPTEFSERQFEILAELQHWGGETNLIDFTTDWRVALFFACDSEFDKDGRIIIQDWKDVKGISWEPIEPAHRVESQKSVFLRPPAGVIQPSPEQIICIPSSLKVHFLRYLQRLEPPIKYDTIYNDLYGFIHLQKLYRGAFVHIHIARQFGNNGEYLKSIYHYKKSIELTPHLIDAHIDCGLVFCILKDYNAAIECFHEAVEWNPNLPRAYYFRAMNIWFPTEEWGKAKADLISAKNNGMDVVAMFRSSHTDVADFERKYNIKLPQDIIEILTDGD